MVSVIKISLLILINGILVPTEAKPKKNRNEEQIQYPFRRIVDETFNKYCNPIKKCYHQVCRSTKTRDAFYEIKDEKINLKRPIVNDNEVAWKIAVDNYNPEMYTKNKTSKYTLIDITTEKIKFNNENDKGINRKSFEGKYTVKPNEKMPENIIGRTGIRGRGVLNKFGPNHAIDVVMVVQKGKKYSFLSLKKDHNQWAITPGYFVDDPFNETLTSMLDRFIKDSKISTDIDLIKNNLMKFNLEKIYNGYVDDIRNTDNAWVETSACFMKIDKTTADMIPTRDDLIWVDLVDENRDYYANHRHILDLTKSKLYKSFKL